MKTLKSNQKQKWLKLIEFAVVSFATWLNPHAGLLLFLLKLCFQILQYLEEDCPCDSKKAGNEKQEK